MNLYRLHSKPETLDFYKQRIDVAPLAFEEARFIQRQDPKTLKYDKQNSRNYKHLEPALATSAEFAYKYAHDILNWRFEAGEDAIMKNARFAYRYAYYVMDERWEEAEQYIMKDGLVAVEYAEDLLDGMLWPAAEKYIMKDAEAAYFYSVYFMEERWPAAEKYIRQDAKWWLKYGSKWEI